MFNLSGSEIVVILLLALVVLGPEKLPDAIRRAGRTYSELKKMGNSFQAEMKSVLDEPMKEMRETADLLKKSVDFTDGAMSTPTTPTPTTATPTTAGPPRLATAAKEQGDAQPGAAAEPSSAPADGNGTDADGRTPTPAPPADAADARRRRVAGTRAEPRGRADQPHAEWRAMSSHPRLCRAPNLAAS